MNAIRNNVGLEQVSRGQKTNGISIKQLECIEFLIHRTDEESISDIAGKVGVIPQTVYNWLKDKRFQVAYTERINSLLFAHRGSITKKLIGAAKDVTGKAQIPAMTLYYKLQGLLQPESITQVNAQVNVQNNVDSSGNGNGVILDVNNTLQVEKLPLVIKRLLMCLFAGCVLDKSTTDVIESFVEGQWEIVEKQLNKEQIDSGPSNERRFNEEELNHNRTSDDGINDSDNVVNSDSEVIDGEIIETVTVDKTIASDANSIIDSNITSEFTNVSNVVVVVDNIEDNDSWLDVECSKLNIYSITEY